MSRLTIQIVEKTIVHNGEKSTDVEMFDDYAYDSIGIEEFSSEFKDLTTIDKFREVAEKVAENQLADIYEAFIFVLSEQNGVSFEGQYLDWAEIKDIMIEIFEQ